MFHIYQVNKRSLIIFYLFYIFIFKLICQSSLNIFSFFFNILKSEQWYFIFPTHIFPINEFTFSKLLITDVLQAKYFFICTKPVITIVAVKMLLIYFFMLTYPRFSALLVWVLPNWYTLAIWHTSQILATWNKLKINNKSIKIKIIVYIHDNWVFHLSSQCLYEQNNQQQIF